MEDILYKLGVQVALEAPGLSIAAAMAVSAFEKIQKAASGTGASAAAAQLKLDAMAKSMKLLLAGGIITAGGIFGLDAIKDWVKASSEMTTELAKLQVTTHGTRSEMDDLESSFTRLTKTSQLSTSQIAGVAQAAAGAGLTNAKQLLATLPALTAYADVLQRTRGVAPDVSVPAAVKMEALFGIRPGTPRFAGLLGAIGEASKISGSPQALMGQLRQAGPSLVNLGVPPEQLIPFLALQQQLGLGASGGARGGLAAIMRGLIPNLRVEGAKDPTQVLALKEVQKLGQGQFFNKAGQFAGIDRMLEIFARAGTALNNPMQAVGLFRTALGKQGGDLAKLLSSPDVLQRTQAIQQQIGTGSLAQDQAALMQTPAAQWTRFKDEMQSIAEILGDTLLPDVLKVVKAFADAAGAVASFLQQHKTIAVFVAKFTEFATAAALVVGPILMIVGAAGVLTAAFGALSIPMAAVGIGIGVIAAAIAGAVLVFTHWHEITKALGPVLSGVGKALAPLGKALGDFGKTMGKELAPLGKSLGGLWDAWGRALGVVWPLLGKVWDVLKPVIGLLAGVELALFTGYLKVMAGVLGVVIDVLTGVVNGITGFVNGFTLGVTIVEGMVQAAGKAVKSFKPLQDVLEGVGKALGTIFDWVKHLGGSTLTALGDFLKKIPGGAGLLKFAGIGAGGGGGSPVATLGMMHVPPHLGAHLVPLHVPAHPVGSHAATHPVALGHPAASRGPLTVHVGGIHVHAVPNESAEALANRVQRKVVDGINRAIAHNHYYGTTDDTIYSGPVKPPLRGY